MSISTIKTSIKTLLDELVTDEVLAGASIHDIKQDPLSVDIAEYPHAFLMPPSVESEVEDNRSVVRTYTFEVMVLFKGENLTSTSELEDAIEAMLDKFDNKPTLDGNARGGMFPVSSTPMPFQHKSGTLIMVVLELKARDLVDLTY